ncbi:response regulator [Roseofilum reptotaenium CS-1145]|uniref:histidine kinase n=1 Tax=Roseofilum reptotaenium AO1-A TaxID=1925591 RepID=A0A1L9QMM4_9CYAN|nr:response regulator [Roseofilum reptotaenium]MDB9516667.1 response regulator [Roseofilum reptotaenium CS-1145]OJJ22639.1 hybrid sensor histidine kinase/response regulator [Roseofilum reptotaenium AO1-A]
MSGYSKLELFREEVETQVNVLKHVIPLLKTQSLPKQELGQAIQAVHAIWGTARMVKREEMANLAQLLKECLIAAQEQTIILGDEPIDLLLHAGDLLLGMSRVESDALENWMTEHSWGLGVTQRGMAALLAPNSSARSQTSSEPELPALETDEASVNAPVPLIDSSEDNEEIPEVKTEIPSPELEQAQAAPTPTITLTADESMIDLFRLEVEAQMVVLNEGLLALESNTQSTQALEQLMRAAHSIKGAARIIGLDAFVNLAHVMEDCFVAAQKGSLVLTADDVDVLLQGVDWLGRVCEINNEELPDWLAGQYSSIETTREEVNQILNPETLPPRQKQSSSVVVSTPESSSLVESSPSSHVQDSSGEGAIATQPSSEVIQPSSDPSGSLSVVEGSKGGGQQSNISDRVVRVSAENLNRIMGLAGESLIEANWLQPYADSMMTLKRRMVKLSRILEQLEDSLGDSVYSQEVNDYLEQGRNKAQEGLDFLGDRLEELELYAQRTANLSDRLYREVITSHMRPFVDGVQGFPRMIRDLARKLNKQVRLEILGKATPVDRDILKKLEAPLTHILRNATDHGIELPEQRIAAGKSPEGTIRLEALHRGGMLAITITDDGKGIDPERLRQNVMNKNLANAEMAAKLTEIELMEFLFLPGFSTAQQVTEISGRGVGLDVAKSMVQEVGGTVRAMSQPGKGTSFHFQLPLTLSVVRTLLVEISGKPYAIPLARIDQIMTLEKSQISEVENRQYFTMNQQHIGLIAAHQVLELAEVTSSPGSLFVVILSDGPHTYGLVVDQFLGERDLVVRPLDPRLGKVPDISATSLMGDGSPILIVDVSDMVRSIDRILNAGRLMRVGNEIQKFLTQKHKRVLVVDDSITVREMEHKLLENSGYQVDTAVNGVEGWNAVRTNTYDLVISDIDMPRMNGIELVKQMKGHPRLYDIPVIIVSYRDREEDRIQGLEAGADYYLTKSSFHDKTLIDAVVDLIGH